MSFASAGEDDWLQATLNRPLITGDRLWADAGARAELQLGAAVIRMSHNTSVALLNLDDHMAQVELAQGTLDVRVRRLDPHDTVEIDTPQLAFSLRQPGSYRIEVDPAGNTTTVAVREGRGEVAGDGAAYVVEARQAYRFTGPGLQHFETVALPAPDTFDRWASDRDRRWDRAVSSRYVSREVIGHADLDEYGTWRVVKDYGSVWIPTRVPAAWAPYRHGHWVWVEPWGWSWIDEAPWGFAPFHYGRWVHIGRTWGWVPGPRTVRPVYAPALVAFIGDGHVRGSLTTKPVDSVAWFPLGPSDVYQPAYHASRDYFIQVNISNTRLPAATVTNVYNPTTVTHITYVNQQAPGAVTAVPAAAFVRAQPVAQVAVPVRQDVIARAPVTAVAAVAPVPTSVRGAAAPGPTPPVALQQRPVVALTAPPAAPVAFAAKEKRLAAKPGKPLDAAELASLTPAAPVPTPKIKVVAPAQPAAAKTPTPPAPAQPAPRTPGAPSAAPQVAPASPATGQVAKQAPPAKRSDEQRKREEEEKKH